MRELLFNVVKHAAVRRASVSLHREGDRIVVTVADLGKGFVPSVDHDAPRTARGLGLFLVRERMVDLGGTMEVVSRPGKGTTITLSAPLGTPPR